MRVARRPIRGPGCVGVLFSLGLHEVRSGSDGPCRPERQGVIGDAQVVPDRVALHTRENQILQRAVAKAGCEHIRALGNGMDDGSAAHATLNYE